MPVSEQVTSSSRNVVEFLMPSSSQTDSECMGSRGENVMLQNQGIMLCFDAHNL